MVDILEKYHMSKKYARKKTHDVFMFRLLEETDVSFNAIVHSIMTNIT